jgi:hypothetical protein
MADDASEEVGRGERPVHIPLIPRQGDCVDPQGVGVIVVRAEAARVRGGERLDVFAGREQVDRVRAARSVQCPEELSGDAVVVVAHLGDVGEVVSAHVFLARPPLREEREAVRELEVVQLQPPGRGVGGQGSQIRRIRTRPSVFLLLRRGGPPLPR